MERPASALRSLAVSMAALAASFSFKRAHEIENFHRGFNQRRRSYRVSRSSWIPGGPNANVRGTYVRNPFIIEQVNAMHEKWLAAKQARDVSSNTPSEDERALLAEA